MEALYLNAALHPHGAPAHRLLHRGRQLGRLLEGHAQLPVLRGCRHIRQGAQMQVGRKAQE